MICVSVMLAIFLTWPLVFGGGKDAAARAAARAAEQAASVAVKPAAATESGVRLIKAGGRAVSRAPSVAIEACFKRYEREYARCGATSSGCRMNVADQWDLCEATGFWPQ
ncbi:MAG: hypothetical protein KF783_06160 [Sphingomonas sp.]|nr:hypothetical protein [Sphingomonas sp.]